MQRFILIGITDNPTPFFPPEVLDVIRNGHVFSGGKRHHDIVRPLLPPDAEWIDITVPIEAVFEKYRRPSPNPCRQGGEWAGPRSSRGLESLPSRGDIEGSAIVVFASGDPLFFGFAATIRRMMPEAEIRLFPVFNSLQLLAHRLVMPYHDMRVVSLTGRPWHEFDRALIEHAPKMGILTDREHTPAAIARRMLDYGYTHYTMHVGEHLGNPTLERVTTLTLEEAAEQEFAMPNCVILGPASAPHREGRGVADAEMACGSESLPSRGDLEGAPFGLPDSSFALLDGREKMITKMPIRLLTLQALDLPCRHMLWDIGACTGSVSIEARLLFPHLHIRAFEVRPECETIIRENARRHGAPGIELHIGEFRSLCCDSIVTPAPDAIFIGGHGGHLREIMAKACQYLLPGGVIVMNSVKAPKVLTDSHRLWDEACHELGLTQEPPTRILLNDNHPIEILKATKPAVPKLVNP